jgi:hypothetical protein
MAGLCGVSDDLWGPLMEFECTAVIWRMAGVACLNDAEKNDGAFESWPWSEFRTTVWKCGRPQANRPQIFP